jgi:hypothetical protein
MAKQSGLGDNFYVGGYDLSGDVSSVDQISGPLALLDVTGIKRSANERIGGLRDGDWQFTSFFDINQGVSPYWVDNLHALPRSDVIATYFRGTLLDSPAAAINGKQIGYDPTRDNTGNLTLKTEIQANGYGMEWGLQLTPGLRTDTTATHGSSVDGSAASTFGAQAYLQVTGITGTSVDVVVEHSTDNSTWSTLIDFGAQAAVGSARAAVTGTVNRYLRVSSSGTFTSATFAVMVARNPVAVKF